jgi:hypothetical protein
MRLRLSEHKEMTRTGRNKYGAVRTTVDGISFASRKEAEYYILLREELKAGGILGFARQPRFPIGAGHEYVADFMVVLKDGTCEVVEVKGVETDLYKLKKSYFDSIYPNLVLKVVK